jgi:hypothetical protein
MEHLIPFSLFEAISLSSARKATKFFLGSGGKERYNEIFKGKDRLYYYMEEDLNKSYIYNPIENDVKKALETSGYEIVDYTKGFASKKGDDKNVFKIQKVLNKIGELDLRNKMDADPLRFSSTKKDKMVVISRHGIDVAGQSTGRDWTSCKSIETSKGKNARYTWSEIKRGSLVAYLITPDDTNITNPIARIIIGVYINHKDRNDFILYPDDSIYGNYRGKDFPDFVKKWCLDFNSKISSKNHGIYIISDKCYADSVIKIKNNFKIFDNIKEYIGKVNDNIKLRLPNEPRNEFSVDKIISDDAQNDQIKYIFKKIEEQENDLKPKDVFEFFIKLNKDFNPSDYAKFINDNSYNDIKKYITKYPDYFINYISLLDYSLISDTSKENQIRNDIKKYYLETEGPEYVNIFKEDMKITNVPLDFIKFAKWLLR